MRVSIKCPSSLLHLEIGEGGMGLRKLGDIYREINIANLLDLVNYADKKSLYYLTSRQRMDDLADRKIINIHNPKKNRKWPNKKMVDGQNYKTHQ